MKLTAAVTPEGPWFVARCLEVDVVSQGTSVEEAKANLVDALVLYLADLPTEGIGPTPLIVTLDIDA